MYSLPEVASRFTHLFSKSLDFYMIEAWNILYFFINISSLSERNSSGNMERFLKNSVTVCSTHIILTKDSNFSIIYQLFQQKFCQTTDGNKPFRISKIRILQEFLWGLSNRNQSLRDLNLISSIWRYIENVKICWFFTQNSQNCLFFYLKLTESNNNIYMEGVILLLNVAHRLIRGSHKLV